MKYREKLIKLINKTKSDLDFAKKTYEDGDDDGLVEYLTYLVKELESINSSINEQPNEEFKGEFDDYLVHGDIRNPNFDGPFGYDDIRKTAIHFANWQKEQTINKACEWLRRCVDVDDEVRMINGEPEAKSFIQKNLHRIEVTNQIIADFKKAMEE